MKIIAIIDERKKVLVEVTSDEIAHIMGKNSIYSEEKEWMKVGNEIPISEQYRDIGETKGLLQNTIRLSNELEKLSEQSKKAVDFAEKLTLKA